MYGIETEAYEKLPLIVVDAFAKAESVINNEKYRTISCSVSGGADSDVMMDLLWRVDRNHKIRYAFFNTGIEYRATLEHLDELERKYGVEIERIKPIKTIPECCREFGTPVISKYVSEHIGRLQKAGFDWKDRPYEEMMELYPSVSCSVRWWCNFYQQGAHSQFNINYNRWLKEFLIENPPSFPVSNKCCHYTKKLVSRQYIRENHIDLVCTGIRKSEGGIRAVSFTNCISVNKKTGIENYRPLFWMTDGDKDAYCQTFNVTHSRCYTEYGFKRTGCAGCPYGRTIYQELESVKEPEPQMYKAANYIFGKAYSYTKAYREYQEEHGIHGRKPKGERAQ